MYQSGFMSFGRIFYEKFQVPIYSQPTDLTGFIPVSLNIISL